MEKIKDMPRCERPREKLQLKGAATLTDAELIALLLGSGTPTVPLHQICATLLGDHNLPEIAAMDMATLCQIKGIGPAKATILLAAAEYCRRIKNIKIIDEQGAYGQFKILLASAMQLQYFLLLISAGRELLAFAEAGGALPDIAWVTELASKAGASRIMLGRNGWPAFSNLEGEYLLNLKAACAALNIVCDGLMAVGPDRFKMI
jgi:DNA repair protein RadC